MSANFHLTAAPEPEIAPLALTRSESQEHNETFVTAQIADRSVITKCQFILLGYVVAMARCRVAPPCEYSYVTSPSSSSRAIFEFVFFVVQL